MRVLATMRRRADRSGRERDGEPASAEGEVLDRGAAEPAPEGPASAAASIGAPESPGPGPPPGREAAVPVRHAGEDEMPRVRLTRRQLLVFVLFAVSVVAFLYLVLPKLAGVTEDLRRIGKGDKWWAIPSHLPQFRVSSAGWIRAASWQSDGYRSLAARDIVRRAERLYNDRLVSG